MEVSLAEKVTKSQLEQRFGGPSANLNGMKNGYLNEPPSQKHCSRQEAQELLEALKREFQQVSPSMQAFVRTVIAEASVHNVPEGGRTW